MIDSPPFRSVNGSFNDTCTCYFAYFSLKYCCAQSTDSLCSRMIVRARIAEVVCFVRVDEYVRLYLVF